MISTKWFQNNDLAEVLNIRTEVFINELNFNNSSISDEYDSFGKSVMVYDDGKDTAGTEEKLRGEQNEVTDLLSAYHEAKEAGIGGRLLVYVY